MIQSKFIIIYFLAVFLIACNPNAETSTSVNVEYKGALKNLMHKGDLSSKANLQDFENTKHLFALGALENLKGEILVFDGKPFISSAINDSVVISNSFKYNAALLVYTSIADWVELDIPASITNYKELEAYLPTVAKANGINVTEPFPFLIKGNAAAFDWHVINWPEGDTEHSHQKHITSGPNGTETNQQVELLGFYSDSHHAIFTHHATNMHLHVKTADNLLAGHLDDLTLGLEMKLYLPRMLSSRTET